MTEQDWLDLASVYRAGVAECRSPHDRDRQQQAQVLAAQADRCEQVARERAQQIEH